MRLNRLILPRLAPVCGEELRRVDRVRTTRDHRADATFSRRLPITLRIIALVGDGGSWIDVRIKVEQHFELRAAAYLSASQLCKRSDSRQDRS